MARQGIRALRAQIARAGAGGGRLLALCALAILPAAEPAAAAPHLPAPGQVFHGVGGGADSASFDAEVGKHSPVFQRFTTWGAPADALFASAERSRARLMVHVSTSNGPGTPERITPRAIAQGHGDGYLVGLGRRMAARGRPVYLRLMAEMNGHWNPYCAFSASGAARGRSHSTSSFRQAWRRTALMLRGGPTAEVNRRLRRLGLPPVRTAAQELARAPVALLWVPQVAGAPNIRGNAPRAYWPGSRYVDWVGTDFYSRFPNFRGLDAFYSRWAHKPFLLGEWALWGRDDPGFVRRLFRWTRRHGRTRMIMYNQGRAGGPFRLFRYPRGRAELRRQLLDPRFATFAPEWR